MSKYSELTALLGQRHATWRKGDAATQAFASSLLDDFRRHLGCEEHGARFDESLVRNDSDWSGRVAVVLTPEAEPSLTLYFRWKFTIGPEGDRWLVRSEAEHVAAITNEQAPTFSIRATAGHHPERDEFFAFVTDQLRNFLGSPELRGHIDGRRPPSIG